MPLPLLAKVAEMETRLGVDVGSLADTDLTRATAALRDASNLVRAEGRDWVATDGTTSTAPDVVLTVVVQAALRAYRNPDNYQGESVEGYSWQAAQGEVGAYLTKEEKRLVKRAAGRTAGTTTVRTPSAYDEAPTDRIAVVWGL